MGQVTASMIHNAEHNSSSTTSTTCIRNATVDKATGEVSAGEQLVPNGKISYLSHGNPQHDPCPRVGSPADYQHQSSIGFEPKAPSQAPAGIPFLLGQMSHQNWVITTNGEYLYGTLNLRIPGASGGKDDSFDGRLQETPNNEQYERDGDGNQLYWQHNDDGSYSLVSTPQPAPFNTPAEHVKRDAQGRMLYYHYDQRGQIEGYYDQYGYWRYREYLTPDARAATDVQYFRPVTDNQGYVDDLTTFQEVRSTHVVTLAGGMPYRLVIRGFTGSTGECSAQPEGEVTTTFQTKENTVTYGCLYASWEQERAVIIEKEVQKAPDTPAPTPIPAFGYDKNPANAYGWEQFSSLRPTGFSSLTGRPTNTQVGVARSAQNLLVPIDGITVTEQSPPANWRLTNVMCVQGPAIPGGTDEAPTFTAQPVEDWNDRARYPLVTRKDGSPITVDPQRGVVDLNNLGMADSADRLAITCRYVNQYGPGVSVAKKAVEQQVQANADGSFALTYTVTVTNPAAVAQVFGPLTDTPSLPQGFSISAVTVAEGSDTPVRITPVPTNKQPFTLRPAGTSIAAASSVVYTVVISGRAASTADWEAAGRCETTGGGDPTLGGFNAVSLPGDPDTTDNDACTTIVPPAQVRVAKIADATGAVAVGPSNTFSVSYTVTVTNSSPTAGTFGPLIDSATVPKGFTITGGTVNGDAVAWEDGRTQLAGAGTPIAGRSTIVYKVTIRGTVSPETADWPAANSCDTAGAGTPGKGAFNSVSMPGDEGSDGDNDACTPLVSTPAISVVKKINDEDANDAPGVSVVAGSMMEVTFLVTNTGNSPLNDVQVSDDVIPGAAITCPATSLAPGASMTCTAQTRAPAAGEQHRNVATVRGTRPNGGTVTDEDPAHAHVPAAPALVVEKKLNGHAADADSPVVVAAGSQVVVTFVVTNTGNQGLATVKVTDDQIPAEQITAPSQKARADGSLVPFDGTLAPGEVAVFTARVTAPQAGGIHKNVAVAEGTPPGGGDPVTSPPDEGHARVPSLKIIKRINGHDANTSPGVQVAPGSMMKVTFEVINDGAVDLSNVRVVDSVVTTGITCPNGSSVIAVLRAGQSITCSVLVKAPEEGTVHHNVARATGTPPSNPIRNEPVPGEPAHPDDTPAPVTSGEDPAYAHAGPKPAPPVAKPPKLPNTGW